MRLAVIQKSKLNSISRKMNNNSKVLIIGYRKKIVPLQTLFVEIEHIHNKPQEKHTMGIVQVIAIKKSLSSKITIMQLLYFASSLYAGLF